MHAPLVFYGQPVWPLLSDFATKGTMILALAMLAWLLLRNKSAATRHLVWTLALASLLLLPPCVRLLH